MASWKKLKLGLLLALSLFVLTGCVRMNLDVKVKWNGKADVTFLYSMQKGMSSIMDVTDQTPLGPEDIEKFREDGWTVEDYSADGYTGYLITKKNVDLSAAELPEGVESSVRREGLRLILDMDLLTGENKKEYPGVAKVVKTAGGSCTVRLTLPLKAEKHNASSVSNHGRTLEWDLLSMDKPEPLHVEVSLLLPVILAAAVLLLVLLLLVFLLVLRPSSGRKQKTTKGGVRKL